MTLIRERDSVFGNDIFVILKDSFIESSRNSNHLKKDTIYKINAWSNDSSIFNMTLENGTTSSVYGYNIIKEIVKDLEKIKEYLATKNKYKVDKIEEFRKGGRLMHPDDILPIANDIFGEDRVYIKQSEIDCFDNLLSYSIYIHFPVINITNSREDKHQIKDLYVRFKIEYDYDSDHFSMILQGRRLSMSLKEWESSYGHSHLSGRGENEFREFCLGSSDFARLMMDTRIEKTEDCWTIMFMALENYLKWESIEGGPYKNIFNITYGNTISEHSAIPHLANIISGIDKKQWMYAHNKLVLKDTHDVYDYFNKYSKLRSASGYTKEDTKYKLDQIKRGTNNYNFDWKGKDIKFEIFSDDVLYEGYQLDKSVMDMYNSIIDRQFNIFNLKKTQNEYKQRNHKKIFGEVSTVQ